MIAKLEQELAKLKQGDHICLIYETTAEQLAAAVTFIMEGLARGERCVYIADDHAHEEVVEALAAAGAEFVEVDRGGSVTFHGPGQLVAYPIVRLSSVFPIPRHPAHGDIDRYLRALEASLIATAARFGVAVARRPPWTGVWADDRKLGAIGVKLAGGVTSHGVALNVATDLSWFDRITPCGIEGAGVASLESLGAPGHTPADVAPVLAAELATAFGLRLDVAGPLSALLEQLPAATAA